MTIAEYVKKFHPNIYETCKSWDAKGWKLEYGDWVKTLQAGFSGYAGRRCQYLGFGRVQDGSDYGNDYHLFGYVGEDARWLIEEDMLFVKVVPI